MSDVFMWGLTIVALAAKALAPLLRRLCSIDKARWGQRKYREGLVSVR